MHEFVVYLVQFLSDKKTTALVNFNCYPSCSAFHNFLPPLLWQVFHYSVVKMTNGATPFCLAWSWGGGRHIPFSCINSADLEEKKARNGLEAAKRPWKLFFFLSKPTSAVKGWRWIAENAPRSSSAIHHSNKLHTLNVLGGGTGNCQWPGIAWQQGPATLSSVCVWKSPNKYHWVWWD